MRVSGRDADPGGDPTGCAAGRAATAATAATAGTLGLVVCIASFAWFDRDANLSPVRFRQRRPHPAYGGVVAVKSFACGDVVPGCDARFVCKSDDEILVQVASHAADRHGMSEVPAAVVDSVRSHIVSV